MNLFPPSLQHGQLDSEYTQLFSHEFALQLHISVLFISPVIDSAVY